MKAAIIKKALGLETEVLNYKKFFTSTDIILGKAIGVQGNWYLQRSCDADDVYTLKDLYNHYKPSYPNLQVKYCHA